MKNLFKYMICHVTDFNQMIFIKTATFTYFYLSKKKNSEKVD